MFPPKQAGKYKTASSVLVIRKDEGSGGAFVSEIRTMLFPALDHDFIMLTVICFVLQFAGSAAF